MNNFSYQNDRKYGEDTLDDIQHELDMVRFSRESGDTNTIEFFEAFDSLIKEVKILREKITENESEIKELKIIIEKMEFNIQLKN